MGILAIGLGTGTASGTAGTVYHLVNHALFKSLLFLCAGAILHRTGLTKLSEMGGLARRMPVVAVAFVIGAASIAGIPPLNGYVSLSLIHTGLLDGHQYLPYTLMLIAQVITIAALGKAAWLAFFRRRTEDYPPLEPLRPGMVGGLASLAACCVVFGVLPQFFLDSVMAPAAASLRYPAQYARGVLTGLARLPTLHLPFDYASPGELVSVAGCAAAGAALAWAYLRTREPGPVRLLRAAHTGSVNEYAAYAIAGMLAVIAVLTLTPLDAGSGDRR
jgi:multicomponent Na+:H+ antiporter subunit D